MYSSESDGSGDENSAWTSASSEGENKKMSVVESDDSEGEIDCKKELQKELLKHEKEILDPHVQVKEEQPALSTLSNGFHHSSDESSSSSQPTLPQSISKNKKRSPTESEEESLQSNPAHDAMPEKASLRKSEISDRIEFEDDSMFQVNGETNEVQIQISENQPVRLKRYVKANPNLRPVPTDEVESDANISDNDEIWLIRCPYSVNIDELQHCSFTLESKSKFKHNGQTYEGCMSNEDSQITVLSCNSSGPLLKNYTLSGAIQFRKKVPKPHYMEDNIIENCQTNFIPLPDTKRRHPLFGIDYKKLMKIPNSVKTRLKNTESVCVTLHNEKKKSKRKQQAEEARPRATKRPRVADDSPALASGVTNPAPTAGDVTDAAPARKRRRRSSRTTNAAQAHGWDSEQAIEQNLFNF